MTEQRMVDYLLSLSPKLQQAYQVMNDLKFATEPDRRRLTIKSRKQDR
ncbi:hypothetical protein [Mammaliicoccus sciuri]|nr:hypothetical protein [Mammaliicoccus sciuri]